MALITLKDIVMPQEFELPANYLPKKLEKDSSLFEQAERKIIKKHKALLIAHYYTTPIIERLAKENRWLYW